MSTRNPAPDGTEEAARPRTKLPIPPACDICRQSATALAAGIRRRDFSVREVAAAFLERIEAVNPLVNAIVSLRDPADVLAEAEAADARLVRGEPTGSLFGLPIAIKDLALTTGLKTTFGSPIFADFVPGEDDIFVERMRRAGAIFIGKTNVPEFGLGSNTYNPVFGPTLNAFDPAWTAGGSSGGAAVALALDMVPVADGSDFGGSLRNPAAYNNVYGLRPSQGLVPAGPSFDVFHAQMGVEGPMGRNVRDIALLLDEQAGYHPTAPLSLDWQGSFLEGLQRAATGGRVAWLGDLGGQLPMEPGILDLCEAGLGRFEGASFHSEAMAPDIDVEGSGRPSSSCARQRTAAPSRHCTTIPPNARCSSRKRFGKSRGRCVLARRKSTPPRCGAPPGTRPSCRSSIASTSSRCPPRRSFPSTSPPIGRAR